jgi:hypothetical protein
MKQWYPGVDTHPAFRVLWLYGLYMLVSNAFFLIGYYLLPEGALRQGPQTAAALVVADAGAFGLELALTLLFNVGVVVLVAVVMNLNRVNGFPVGYLYPILLGVLSGLVPGTNSFVSSDLADYTVREGMALSLSIGNLEMLGYICMIAATVGVGVYEYRSWWRWGGEWKAAKLMPLREVRLTRTEWAVAAIGVALVVVAAIRETMMARGML